MRFIPNPFRLIQRIRHAYGFSVHSPFAFDLILNTIHTPHSYYIYEDNKREIDRAGLMKAADFKYAELLFRLTNRFNTKDILEIGSGYGINTLYIKAHSKQTMVHCVEKDDEKLKIAQQLLVNKMRNIVFIDLLHNENKKFDAIIWDLNIYPTQLEETLSLIQDRIKEDGFIILKGINKSKKNKQLWGKACELNKLTMSFDLGSIGIGFFRPSLPKTNYDVYF